MTQTAYGHGRPLSTVASNSAPFLKIAQYDDPAKIEGDEISNRLVQEDWTDFRTLDSLCRRAGVSRDKIPAVVMKEVVDNALDASDECSLCGGGAVANGGTIPGSDEDIARLFSIGRPRESSKLLRIPNRGALGNGLRIVAGAVLASGGTLRVTTGGRTLTLEPRDDGTTAITEVEPWPPDQVRHMMVNPSKEITIVDIKFGPSLKDDFHSDDSLAWAEQAIDMAGRGRTYKGKSSPFWFESDAWFELLQAHKAMPVRQLMEKLDGLTGRKAGEAASSFLSRSCTSLSRDEADELLGAARKISKPVKAKRLGFVGGNDNEAYARETGFYVINPGRGEHAATIPFVAEAWARVADKPSITVCVNRTPVTAEAFLFRSSKDHGNYLLSIGDDNESFKVGRKDYSITLNLITPYMPILNDGKSPDIWRTWNTLEKALIKAVNRAKATGSRSEDVSQIQVIRESLDAAISKVSAGGKYRYSLRQLFYAIRHTLLDKIGREPKYGTFAQHITTIESERGGDLPGIYRDNRGVLYHPHTSETIPLGTQSIERYERPKWSFSKVLYCEKEGFFPSLQDAKWPERHDCALVTGKGYASRAARDLLDLLGESDEPLKIFCIHDADGPGTVIYQALAGATTARGKRDVEIINLGLEPAEALEMGLAVENVDKKRRGKVPVASYVPPQWKDWLQSKRVELNAMTPGQLITWLDRKMAEHGGAKVIPPADVQAAYLSEKLDAELRNRLTERAIKEFKVDAKLKEATDALQPEIETASETLDQRIRDALAGDPADWWRGPVEKLATELAESHLDGNGGLWP